MAKEQSQPTGFTQVCTQEDFSNDPNAELMYEQMIYTGLVSNDKNRPVKKGVVR